MGCTVPKPPKFKSIYVPETNFPGTSRLPHVISLPTWVDVPENYYVASCKMQRFMNSQAAVVVFCRNSYSMENWDDRGYAKVYVYDDDGAQPFPQMKGIIQEIRKRKLNYSSTGSYEISEDGKIRESVTKDIPSDETLRHVAVLMMELHERWRDYPNIDNFDMVERLEMAKDSIRRMNDEETYHHKKKRVENIRQSIKAEQEQISQIERDLNTMYEEAADAMNLLEENGIDPNHFDDKPKEEALKDSSVDVKFADTNIRYIGTADILKLTTGNDVLINNLSYDNPKIGDVVVDPKNGRSAVMDIYGHWQLVST